MENRLRYLRERKGLSRASLAKLAKTTSQTIERLEKGERQMTLRWMERLAPHVGATPAALISEACDPESYTELLRDLLQGAGMPEDRKSAMLLLFETAARSLAAGYSVRDALSPTRLGEQLKARALTLPPRT